MVLHATTQHRVDRGGVNKGHRKKNCHDPLKVCPFTLTPENVLHKRENEKHFKELEIKSGSSHVWIKPFFNSEILLIPLFCSMVILFWIRH